MIGTPPRDRAVVFCANHQSNVDPPVLFHVLHPAVRILYKRELDKIPVMTRSFRMGGFIPVDRGNKDAAMKSIDAGAASIRSGHSFLIFPEGTRSKTDEMLPFKKGRLHHGNQSPGAHRPCGRLGWPGRDDERELAHSPGEHHHTGGGAHRNQRVHR